MNCFRVILEKLRVVSAKTSMRMLGVVFGLLLFSLPSFAQLNLGSISGTVTDQTGGAIAGATVNVIDVARGVTRALVSDGAGEYSAPSVTPGTYTVHVEATGFQSVNRENVLVQVGQSIRVDVTMQPGQQTQTITVTGELPMVNTTNAQLGNMLENLSVEELPTNGRNYQYLLAYRPGMVEARQSGSTPYTSVGTDGKSMLWMFDGLYDGQYFGGTNAIVGGQTQGPDAPTILPLDSIQEVNTVLEPKAEFGWRAGAHVNVGLKSGTNSLHGSAYAFGRDTDLNARNPFLLPNEPKSPMAMEQFGASLGGPIKRNKLFYFINYEGQRYNVGTPQIAHLPTYADLGPATSGATGSSIPDAVFDILHNVNNTNGTIPSALSLNLMGCTALVPPGSVTPGGTLSAAQVAVLKSETSAQLASGCNAAAGLFGGNTTTSTNDVTDFVGSGQSDNGIGKIDWHPNDHHAINGEVFYGGGPQFIAATAIEPYWLGYISNKSNVARGVWVWTPNSRWVNDLRFGYEDFDANIFNYECAFPKGVPNYSALGFIPGNYPCTGPSSLAYGGFPVVSVTGFTNMGNTEGIEQDQTDRYEAINDSVSYTRGRHQFKFGVETRYAWYGGNGSSGGRGIVNFGSVSPFTGATALEDFMSGVPGTGQIIAGQQYDAYHFNQYAAYVQDDWRVFPKLTLNLGLRYEYTGSLWAVGNHMANFQPSATSNPTGLIDQTPGHNLYSQSPTDFAPRIGLAYDLTGNGRTVVRAGFGLIYQTLIQLVSVISSQGASLSFMPSGFTFYNPNGSTFVGPGNITTGELSLATAQLPWDVNVPVFEAASPAGLTCGTGVAPVHPVAGAPAVEPAPCMLQAENPNFGHQGQVYFRTFGIQHAFTNNLSMDISYVGNHGGGIIDATQNINEPTPGAKNTAANGYIEQARRPYNTQFPFYGVINYQGPSAVSNYNSLQATLTQRLAHGFNFTGAYTFTRYLNNDSNWMIQGNSHIDYGNASTNVPNTATFTMTYIVPGRKSPGQLLEGWQVSTDFILEDSTPANPTDSTDDESGTSINSDRWTLAGTPKDFKIGGPGPVPCWGVVGSSFSKAANCTTVATVANMPSLCQSTAAAEPVNPSLPAGTPAATGLTALAAYGCYMMGSSVMVPPAQGTYGTMARDELYYKGFHDWNISVTKNIKFKERYSAQFRAEFYNVLNRTLYASPTVNLSAPTTFGSSSSTPDINNPVIGAGPRKIQLGLKLVF